VVKMFRVGVFVFFFFISAVWQSQTNLPTHFLNFLWDGSADNLMLLGRKR